MVDFSVLPEGLRAGMQRYVKHGILPGSFLQAVISNDLTEAFLCADDYNTEHMREIALFVYDLPFHIWGSKEKMLAWVKANRPAHSSQ